MLAQLFADPEIEALRTAIPVDSDVQATEHYLLYPDGKYVLSFPNVPATSSQEYTNVFVLKSYHFKNTEFSEMMADILTGDCSHPSLTHTF